MAEFTKILPSLYDGVIGTLYDKTKHRKGVAYELPFPGERTNRPMSGGGEKGDGIEPGGNGDGLLLRRLQPVLSSSIPADSGTEVLAARPLFKEEF